MAKLIEILLLILWVVSAPIMMLAIGFAGLEIFNPAGMLEDVQHFEVENIFYRLAALFTVIFPFYFVFNLLRRNRQDT